MLNTIIHDPLGLDTGIKITHVRSLLDRDGDKIMIYGRMSGDRVVGLDVEPDLQCDIINQKGQICMSACSDHHGVFGVTKRVTFKVQIESVSKYMDWDDISKISLYVIFRRASR